MDTQHAPQPRYTLQEAATLLGVGQRDLFRELRRRRILDQRNVPARRYKEAGYLREIERTYRHPVVGPRFYTRPIVTERGLEWLRSFLVEHPEVSA